MGSPAALVFLGVGWGENLPTWRGEREGVKPRFGKETRALQPRHLGFQATEIHSGSFPQIACTPCGIIFMPSFVAWSYNDLLRSGLWSSWRESDQPAKPRNAPGAQQAVAVLRDISH